MTTPGGTPPGWYDDGTGTQRWYDGSQWTEHVNTPPPPPTAPEPVPAAPAYATDPPPSPAQPAYVADGGLPADAPKKPVYKRAWFIATAAVVVLIVVIAAASSGGSDGTKAANSSVAEPVVPQTTAAAPVVPATTAAAPVTTAAAPVVPATTAAAPAKGSFPLQDGDWRLENVRIQKSFDSFGGTARVTYTGDDPSGGSNLFTVTVFKNGEDIATLSGAANDVAPGKTVSVGMLSTDDYVKGPYTFEFQNDL